jgi:predicted NBD/HSP70 family sugar kinase
MKQKAYKRLIVKNVYFKKAVSCAELSLQIEKSLPVATQLLLSLVDEGIVEETGYAKSTGGRKPVLFALKPDILYVVAVAMDQFVTRIAIMNMQNEFVGTVIKLELPLLNNKNALNILVEKMEELIENSGILRSKFAGAGIGMPGFIDVKRGLNHSYLFSEGKSIAEYIKEKLKIPVIIDNDSSIMALAELKFGSGFNTKSAMVVNVGWGIGLGIILNSELYRGINGFAGEFSHVPLSSNDKLCVCGKSGCLETEASLLVVVEKAMEGVRNGQVTKLKELNVDDIEQACIDIIKAAQEGDQFAIEILSYSGFKIGMGIALLIHLLNPEFVILTGRGAAAGKILLTPLQQAINEYCIPSLSEYTSIKISELGADAELIGAAALVMENYDSESGGNTVKIKKHERENILN